MKDPIESKHSMFSRILSVLPPVILISTNLFLFAPFSIYEGNLSEFSLSFVSIVSHYTVPVIVCVVGLLAVAIPLTPAGLKRYVSILFGLGILIWLQGNLLRWDYGLIGKGDIDWTQNSWRGYFDSAIWIGLITCTVIFYNSIVTIVRSMSILVISMQVLIIIIGGIRHPEVWAGTREYSAPSNEMFEFSSKQNVIHVILDELQSDVFQKIVAEDRERYDSVFEGFTLFKETSGSFPTTLMSIPALLSGEVYSNNVPIQEFIDTIYKGNTIPNVLFDSGFEVDMASSIDWYGKGRYTNWYHIPVPYGVSVDEFEQMNSSYMLGLVLFRHAPHFAKKWLYEELTNLPTFDMDKTLNYEAMRHFANRAFLEDLIQKSTVKRSRPLYKFFHLTTTHWPMVMNDDCQYSGEILPFTWKNIHTQAKCSIDHFVQFIEKLKQLGIYESATIIINADHGYWKIPESARQVSTRNSDKELLKDFHNEEDFARIVCASSPLLAIKLPQTKGPLVSSEAAVSLTDIPATLASLVGIKHAFKGNSVFEISPDATRERRFNYYLELPNPGQEYLGSFDEYSIRGSLYDRLSWRFVGRHLPHGSSYSTRQIIFGTQAAAQFLLFGWSFTEMDPGKEGLTYSWAMGDAATIALSIPKARTTLTANVRAPFNAGTQIVVVRLDGKIVGTWKNSEHNTWERHSITIPEDETRPAVSAIEFSFSRSLPATKEEPRRLALLFQSITLEEESK
jgi:hypothetical protein